MSFFKIPIILMLIILVFLFGCSAVYKPTVFNKTLKWEPWHIQKTTADTQKNELNKDNISKKINNKKQLYKFEFSLVGFIEYYQKELSPLDGPRCPFSPTCSAFTKTTLERYGLVLGFPIIFDRLFVKEKGFLFEKYAVIKNNGKIRFYDPVP